jgi:ketosteroid isomerase-like protein
VIEPEQDVIAANERFYAAFNTKDFEAVDRAWASRDDVVCIHPGWNILKGRTAVVQSWGGILTNPGQPRIVAGGASATVVGDVAILTCRELVGGSPLAATNVFVNEAGEWRLLHHQSGPVAVREE